VADVVCGRYRRNSFVVQLAVPQIIQQIEVVEFGLNGEVKNNKKLSLCIRQ